MIRRLFAVSALALAALPAGARAAESPPEAVCVPIGPTSSDVAPFSGPDGGTCTGVRPGSLVSGSPEPGGCTLNFLFEGGDGYRYIGTAGHCIFNGPARTWVPGTGPAAYSRGERIGEFAYSVVHGEEDFALVRLDPNVPASAEMCHFGGPTALYTSLAHEPRVLRHFGNGAAWFGVPVPLGVVSPARTGVTTTTRKAEYVLANMAISGGDSGSPVITDTGEAVGVAVALAASVNPNTGVGMTRITRVSYQVPRAAAALGTTLTLQTAALK